MPVFQVTWTEEMWHSTYIKAKSEDEAREMVFSGQITCEPYESEIQDSVEVRLVDHLDSKREQTTPKTAHEWREAIWPTKWECCPPPEERIPSIQNEDEKEGLDPVFPLCQMCTDPADIVCRVTPDSPGLYVCNRCHKGEGFRYITNCYDHHSAT